MAAKHTKLKNAEKRIEAQNEEIHYLKTKAYQLITTNKNLKKQRISNTEYIGTSMKFFKSFQAFNS